MKGTHLWRLQRKDTSEHGEKATLQGAPMSGGLQREALVRKGEGCRTPTSGVIEGGHVSVRTQKRMGPYKGQGRQGLVGIGFAVL